MKKILSVLLVFLIIFGINPKGILAGISDYRKPKVSITFDDGFESTYTNALPVLSQRGIKATVYITTDFIGKPGYMTWDQVISLQNDYGWEIGSHTVTHKELEKAKKATIIYEVVHSLTTLLDMGLNVTNFASPYGAYDNNVLAIVAKYYNSHRGFWDRDDLNLWPYNNSVLMNKSVESSTTPDEVYSYINQAKTENKWLILTLHEVKKDPDPGYSYTTTIKDLELIADYIINSGIKVNTVEGALYVKDTNIVSNFSFEEGMSGWKTNNPSSIYVDYNENGSYPNPKASLKINGTRSLSYVISDRYTVSSDSKFGVRVFYNSISFTSGEVGIYMDEYNENGNWISGKWLGQIRPKNVAYFGAIYAPTSDNVLSISIQIYSIKGTKGTVYVDNVKIYDLDSEPTTTPDPTETPFPVITPTPTPTIKPTPTPTPSPLPSSENLVQNPGFENIDENGWAYSWIRQTGDFVIDTDSSGNEGNNSVKLDSEKRTHLFSDKISVNSGLRYTWSSYIKVEVLGSEFGFYIDEYNSNGNWISGQWKGSVNANQNETLLINYTPTSANVNQVGLQYYSMGGSPSKINLDSVELYAN